MSHLVLMVKTWTPSHHSIALKIFVLALGTVWFHFQGLKSKKLKPCSAVASSLGVDGI